MSNYQIFAMAATTTNIEAASKERFARITPKYILIYSKECKLPGTMAINGEDLNRLTKQDEQWVKDCIATLLADVIKTHPQTVENAIAKHVEDLERALKAEEIKLQRAREGNGIAANK